MQKIERTVQTPSQDNQDQRQGRPRKLQLHKETVRNLSNDQLRSVAGGISPSNCGLDCSRGTGNG